MVTTSPFDYDLEHDDEGDPYFAALLAGANPTEFADLVARPAWMADPDLGCRDEPTSTFFPDKGGTYDRARKLCAACPQQPACLEFVTTIETAHRHGMYGGTTPMERKAQGAVRSSGRLRPDAA